MPAGENQLPAAAFAEISVPPGRATLLPNAFFVYAFRFLIFRIMPLARMQTAEIPMHQTHA